MTRLPCQRQGGEVPPSSMEGLILGFFPFLMQIYGGLKRPGPGIPCRFKCHGPSHRNRGVRPLDRHPLLPAGVFRNGPCGPHDSAARDGP